MVCKDKRKVWVNVKGHERRVLKCQNNAPPNKLKVKLPGIEKRQAIATPEPRRIHHKKTPLRKLRVALKRLTFRKPYKKISTYEDEALNDIKPLRDLRPARKYLAWILVKMCECFWYWVSTLVQSLFGCLENYGRETKTRYKQQRPGPRDVKDTKFKLPG